ncbi:MAG: hypothetical protein KGL52_14065 [Rhodospirillales bacterium]|nr:hypothetical protein [Rhodospirillales bacterium]
MTKRFAEWRPILEADLQKAEQEHAAAVTAAAKAAEGARAARLELREIAEHFDRLDRRATLAGALAGLRYKAENELAAAIGSATHAAGLAENGRRYVADLRLALDQLGQIDPPPAAEQGAPEAA